MRILRFLSHLYLVFLFFGCATRAVQTESITTNSHGLPIRKKIENVFFVDQSAGYCGPATLSMAMQWAGSRISVQELANLVYTPGLKGSLQSDLIGASRREGFIAVTIHSLHSLLGEVAAGHPVIIFENLGLTWSPQWHYALVTGYDLEAQEVIMHSGHTANYHWDMKKFERSWMLADYWGLVILPAGQLAATVGESEFAGAVVALENLKKYSEAEQGYLAVIEKWPENLVAHVGLANLAFQRGDRKKTIYWLNKGLVFHPDSKILKNNLIVVETSKN